MQIRLNRALKLEAEQTDETLELKQVVETPAVIGGVPVEDDEVSPVRQKTYAKRDYEAIIQRLLGRIESLTATRQRLLSAQLDYELKLAAKESGAVFMPHVIELVAPVVKQDDESAD